MNIATLETPAAGDDSAVSIPPRRFLTPRHVLGGVVALGVITAGIALFHWFAVGRFIESTNNAYLRADQVAMAPRVSGYVSDIYVTDNQDVVAGQPLLKIDTPRYETAVRQAQATVEMRQADVAKSEADMRLQDAIIAQAQADAENAGTNVDFAQKEFGRSVALSRRGVTSQQTTDQVDNALAKARSAKTLKEAALDAARRQVATLKAEVDQARAQLAEARESLRAAEIDLGDTVLRSPVAGRVGDRTVRVGQLVQPGTRVLSVVPTGQLYLVANFKETQIERMRIDQPAKIRVDAYPNLALSGVVESFAPGTGAQFALLPPENATGNFTKVVQRVPVRIAVVDAPKDVAGLVPGLSIEVSVNTKVNPPARRAEAR